VDAGRFYRVKRDGGSHGHGHSHGGHGGGGGGGGYGTRNIGGGNAGKCLTYIACWSLILILQILNNFFFVYSLSQLRPSSINK
jgi:hypothetical protein